MNTLALISPINRDCQFAQIHPVQRLLLCDNELYRVPTKYHWLRVLIGTAYVTQAGQDHILPPGQAIQLKSKADIALVSALTNSPLVIELYKERR